MTDNEKKAQAQEVYCEQHEIPMFAPKGGRCPRCMCNIYEHMSESEAGSRQITSCPNCRASFLD